MRRAFLLAPAAVAFFAVACGGVSGHMPTNSDLVADTTIGAHRCKLGQSDDRPFVVEWDSTDLASFEAKAQRDVVFVKVDGCSLTVLDCRDDGIAGKYGIYDPVAWTSGSVEGFDIKNEGELFAKLPLGAVSLAGQVNAGNALHLQYFVSGWRPADRNAVYRGELAGNSLCESATHFVAGYDLGAFVIDASNSDKEAASAGVKSFGGGGSLAHEESHLKHAGKIEDCTSDSARDMSRCKAPIRLSLRTIADGQNPRTPQANGVAAQADPGTASPAGPAGGGGDLATIQALVESATRKLELRDGTGCLIDLDRLAQADSRGTALGKWELQRAQCEMLAGQCDVGKKRYARAMAAAAPTLSPAQIDMTTTAQAARLCGAGASTPTK